MVNSGMLMLGLGGTGFDMLTAVKTLFNRRFERATNVEYLEIDRDRCVIQAANHGESLAENEFLGIGDLFPRMVDAIGDSSFVREWLDPGIHPEDAYMSRQGARLALFYDYERIRAQLTDKLRRAATFPYPMPGVSNVVDVAIFASLGGYTGSGIFLDLAYILWKIARGMNISIHLRAFLMMPDVNVMRGIPHDPIWQKHIQTNGYAALKELDYWMDCENNGAQLVQNYTAQDSIRWDCAPFDKVYLLCAATERGALLRNAYEHNIRCVAEYLAYMCECSASMDAVPLGTASPSVLFSRLMNYRVLGICDSADDERLMLLKECTLMVDAAVNAMDDSAHAAGMTGQAPVEFTKSILTLESYAQGTAGAVIRRDFEIRHPRPSYETLTQADMRGLDHISAPHGREYDSFVKSLENSFQDEVIRLDEEIWRLFLDKANAVGTDINRGPQYLYSLLEEGVTSLLHQTECYMGSLDGLMMSAWDGIQHETGRVRDSFSKYQNASFIERLAIGNRLCQEYLHYVNNLYDATLCYMYYRALRQAMACDFIPMLRKFTALLGESIAAIRFHRQDCAFELAMLMNRGTLFNAGALCGSLDAVFAADGNAFLAISAIYQAIMTQTGRMQDDLTRDVRMQHIIDDLEAERQSLFAPINMLSLEQKIQRWQQIEPGDQAMQAYVRNGLCDVMMMRADTMFPSAHTWNCDWNLVRFSMVAIPSGAVNILAGVRQYCQERGIDAVIVATQNSDRVTWINEVCGLPLNACQLLEPLHQNYHAGRDREAGCHLYMADNPDALKGSWAELMPDTFATRAAQK